jgi:nucleoside-diphosphate-sugar epimerase
MKKILLTGGTGFVGRHCIPFLLEKGYEIHGVSSKDMNKGLEGIQWHKANLLIVDQIKKVVEEIKPTHLLHLAWYTVPGKYWNSEENLSWVQASIELIRQFTRNGGERIVVGGSCAEYDWRYGYCSEGITPTTSSTVFGVCKNILQQLLRVFSIQECISHAWARMFHVYGPYEHPDRLVAYVIRSLLKGEVARCSQGTQIRDFLHVSDVANACVRLLDSQVSGPVNIASGCSVTLREIIQKIGDGVGRPQFLEFGAIPISDNDPPFLSADITRLSREVNWKPHYTLDAGLKQTIEWWKSVNRN